MSALIREIERLEQIEPEARSAQKALAVLVNQLPKDMIDMRVALLTVAKSLERVLGS